MGRSAKIGADFRTLIGQNVISDRLFFTICHQLVIRGCHQGVMTGDDRLERQLSSAIAVVVIMCNQVVKMPNPLLSVRISPELDDLLQQKENETGMSRSALTIAALETFLKPPSPADELARLKVRVEALERQFSP